MLLGGTVRRAFWVSMGATAGVLIFRQVTKTAKEFTPAGIADRVSVSGGSLTDSVKSFWEDVKDAMHDREEELNVALGIDVPPVDSSAPKAVTAKSESIKSESIKSESIKSESNGSSKNARAITGRSDDDA